MLQARERERYDATLDSSQRVSAVDMDAVIEIPLTSGYPVVSLQCAACGDTIEWFAKVNYYSPRRTTILWWMLCLLPLVIAAVGVLLFTVLNPSGDAQLGLNAVTFVGIFWLAACIAFPATIGGLCDSPVSGYRLCKLYTKLHDTGLPVADSEVKPFTHHAPQSTSARFTCSGQRRRGLLMRPDA